jgi:hypothetical protein
MDDTVPDSSLPRQQRSIISSSDEDLPANEGKDDNYVFQSLVSECYCYYDAGEPPMREEEENREFPVIHPEQKKKRKTTKICLIDFS